jgi:hypothetical protein
MSEIARSIRGHVKDIFLPAREARVWFATSSAPLTIEDASVVLCPGLLHLSSCIFVSSDDADRVLKLASRVVVRCGKHGSI